MSGGLAIDIDALRAAGFVGTWATDVEAGTSILDHGAALMIAGDATLAGKPLTIDRVYACIHDEDRDWMFERIAHVRRRGGSLSAEFRIHSANGEIRTILGRGTAEPDLQGRMQGRGVFFDLTEGHRGRFRPTAPEVHPQVANDPLDVAAKHCIATRELIVRTGNPMLRLLADALLLELGHALAQTR